MYCSVFFFLYLYGSAFQVLSYRTYFFLSLFLRNICCDRNSCFEHFKARLRLIPAPTAIRATDTRQREHMIIRAEPVLATPLRRGDAGVHTRSHALRLRTPPRPSPPAAQCVRDVITTDPQSPWSPSVAESVAVQTHSPVHRLLLQHCLTTRGFVWHQQNTAATTTVCPFWSRVNPSASGSVPLVQLLSIASRFFSRAATRACMARRARAP